MEQHDGEHAEQVHPLHQAHHAPHQDNTNKNNQFLEQINYKNSGIQTCIHCTIVHWIYKEYKLYVCRYIQNKSLFTTFTVELGKLKYNYIKSPGYKTILACELRAQGVLKHIFICYTILKVIFSIFGALCSLLCGRCLKTVVKASVTCFTWIFSTSWANQLPFLSLFSIFSCKGTVQRDILTSSFYHSTLYVPGPLVRGLKHFLFWARFRHVYSNFEFKK